MPVESDVTNPTRAGRLTPGMLADVIWPVKRLKPTLFVPTPAVVTSTKQTVVIRVRNGMAEWVQVRRSASARDNTEAFGVFRLVTRLFALELSS